MDNESFTVAMGSLVGAEGHVSQMARSFLQFLPVSGASISTFGSLLSAETISATDATAGRVDELQFDLGEGPCWDALHSRRPVMEPDVLHHSSGSWPAFSEAIRSEQIGAIFAFPLVFGPLDIGAVDLYSVEAMSLTREQQEQTQAMSAIVSRILLRNVIEHDAPAAAETAFSRRVIHQATGMVLVQLETNADDAYLVIQARAFAEGRSMQDVAVDVVERRLRFDDGYQVLGEQ